MNGKGQGLLSTGSLNLRPTTPSEEEHGVFLTPIPSAGVCERWIHELVLMWRIRVTVMRFELQFRNQEELPLQVSLVDIINHTSCW